MQTHRLIKLASKAMARVDVINVHATAYWGFMPAVVVALLGQSYSCRTVLTLHGAYTKEFCARWLPLFRAVCHRYEQVTVPSKYLLEILQSVDVNAVLLPNILSYEGDYKGLGGEAKRDIISIRPLSPPYNVDLVLTAFQQILEHYPDASMTVVADHREIAVRPIQALAHKLGEAKFKVLPALSHDELMRQLVRHEFMISASSRETFGISIMESMSSGAIPICAAVGNATALIGENERGFLIRQITVAEIAKTIDVALASSKPQRSRLRAAMKEYVLDYSWAKQRDAYLKVLLTQ